MKIYRYHPETGVYLGEDFADEAPWHRGVFVIPPDATDIAPPHAEGKDIPVFDSRLQQWELRRHAASAQIPLCAKLESDGKQGVSQ